MAGLNTNDLIVSIALGGSSGGGGGGVDASANIFVNNDSVFRDFKSTVKELKLGSQIEGIYTGALDRATNLEKLDLYDTKITKIANGKITGTSALKTLILPHGIAELGGTALSFANNNGAVIKCPFSEGAISWAPWGAPNATIEYDYKP